MALRFTSVVAKRVPLAHSNPDSMPPSKRRDVYSKEKKMKNVLDHTSPIQRHFEEMTRIPHGSYNEKQYSDYLVEFAKKHNLAYKQY